MYSCMQNNEHSDAIKHMFPIPLVLGLDIKKNNLSAT